MESAARTPEDEARLADLWHRARAALEARQYDRALGPLDDILTLTPEDPWAKLYRSLAQSRAHATGATKSLGAEEWSALRQRLKEEERRQAGQAEQRRAVERAVRREQTQWDRELQALQREKDRQAREKAREARREPTRQPAPPAPAPATRPTIEPPSPKPAPPMAPAVEPAVSRPPAPPKPPRPRKPKPEVKAPAPEAPPQPAETPAPAVPTAELPGLVAPTPPRAPGARLPASPRQTPVGAVRINAGQMSVATERNVAIAERDVEVLYGSSRLTCDRLTLFTDTHDAYAQGHVRLEQEGQIVRADMAHVNLETQKGRFLEGTLSMEPWHEHGRSMEHLAQGVYRVTPGYVTSCDQEPPHFKFYGREATVVSEERVVRARNTTLFVGEVPLIYLPWLSLADHHMPFYIIPGTRKPWEQFALMGYRYEWPANHKGNIHVDWRRTFGWGTGLDHQFDAKRFGKGLFRVYYNDEGPMRTPKEALPKGARINRYRVLWRHLWEPQPGTTVTTDIQKFSDADFRKDFLFREEFVEDSTGPQGFVSVVKGTPWVSAAAVVQQRMNRFQTEDELEPQLTFDVREQRIGETNFFSKTRLDVANMQKKRAHSDRDTDVSRVDLFEQLSYAVNLLRPLEITQRAGVRETYHSKDIQSGDDASPGTDRPQGNRDLLSGQFSTGTDASLKLFRIFPLTTNSLGLDINWLRHVLTPSVSYTYIHRPTVPPEILAFSAADGQDNSVTFGLENKLQTRRRINGSLRGVELARFFTSLPYTFNGSHNKAGGRLGDWAFDLELYPWYWMRLESDWGVPSHFVKGSRDNRIRTWNVDWIVVGGKGTALASTVPGIQAPERRIYEPGAHGGDIGMLMPEGQWYFGLGHRYSQNDKTEGVIQFDWRPSAKWEIGTFHRLTYKEVVGGSKRFNNVREYQYTLRRDLHDWLAEFIYRVDREFGEEIFFTMTLKAFPGLPIEMGDSYHQPKAGSQSSPFSPVPSQ